VPLTVIVSSCVVAPFAGEVIVTVGAVVSCGDWRITWIVVSSDRLPAESVARALIGLLPIVGSETLLIVQAPVAELNVAGAPLTVTCATPDALAPTSEAVPLTVVVSETVVEPSPGELMLTVGAVVSATCRVTVMD